MLAKAVGISLWSVQRILEAYHLAPHLIRTFKLSNDPKFADNLTTNRAKLGSGNLFIVIAALDAPISRRSLRPEGSSLAFRVTCNQAKRSRWSSSPR
jgi:hypothetical protein